MKMKKATATEALRGEALKKKLNRMAWVSDSLFTLPGNIKVGVDSLVGLIPVVGDALSALYSIYMIKIGFSAKVPKILMLYMFFNVVCDAVLGSIPVIGDVFDVFFKANERNAAILNRYADAPIETKKSANRWLILLLCILTVVMVMAFVLVGYLVKLVIGLF
ncbi:DUF4112 domain-containing protein [Marinicella rhabdoformis]|uniref:DUF4112 domain-containing protein n=1 Tax=Marinicella rhabdoformis TaxID=2580566 RepID=UPI0012AEB3E2|nr:DUF4112 domain-containing protein [Marinicella rhabdoformis]